MAILSQGEKHENNFIPTNVSHKTFSVSDMMDINNIINNTTTPWLKNFNISGGFPGGAPPPRTGGQNIKKMHF